jgi:hypothetical protein
MKPQDYSARTAYRPPAVWYRRLNWLGVLPGGESAPVNAGRIRSTSNERA